MSNFTFIMLAVSVNLCSPDDGLNHGQQCWLILSISLTKPCSVHKRWHCRFVRTRLATLNAKILMFHNAVVTSISSGLVGHFSFIQ